MTGAVPTCDGWLFEDILDGYFPLRESLRQCLIRQRAATGLFVLTYAPILHLPDRPGDAPVPLRLEAEVSGLVRRLMMVVRLDETGQAELRGVGAWRWHHGDSAAALTPDTRLAEPAFVRGIAVAQDVDGCLWRLSGPDGFAQSWGFDASNGIVSLSEAVVSAGDSSPRADLVVHAPDAATPAKAAQMKRDWQI
ncbi:hypothetical protein E7681_10180 [Thalassobius vesicularis]|uniref:Uncharacterized protein n=1 Tax=Thalassobius vesicularis TaxID=1294297 RepID=A0A4V3UZ16_9RHOB|nr:hypothetical protein E7681_10180 [Thalassobius vesicularis]